MESNKGAGSLVDDPGPQEREAHRTAPQRVVAPAPEPSSQGHRLAFLSEGDARKKTLAGSFLNYKTGRKWDLAVRQWRVLALPPMRYFVPDPSGPIFLETADGRRPLWQPPLDFVIDSIGEADGERERVLLVRGKQSGVEAVYELGLHTRVPRLLV